MKYTVSPLTCGRCVRRITDALLALDPAATIRADLAAGTVDADGAFDATSVVPALAAIGYAARPTGTPEAPASPGGCCGTHAG